MKFDLSVEIAGIKMQNPVMNAAGTFEVEPMKDFFDINILGAYVQKSITRKPREGNPQPRIYETVGGMINRIGLQNVGVEEFIAKKLPLLRWLEIPVIINVAGESVDDYGQTCIILQERAKHWIQALEINVSCPNVKDGLIFGSNPDLLFELVKTLRSSVSFPLIVKLTPNVTDITIIAKAAVSAGADALSLINTVKAAAYIERGPNAGQWIEGGLSGPCIKPIALYLIRQVSKVVEVPLIAMGGICNTEDALDFLRIRNVWGIAVGTASFRDPSVMSKIIDGLSNYLKGKGYSNLAELKAKEAR